MAMGKVVSEGQGLWVGLMQCVGDQPLKFENAKPRLLTFARSADWKSIDLFHLEELTDYVIILCFDDIRRFHHLQGWFFQVWFCLCRKGDFCREALVAFQ